MPATMRPHQLRAALDAAAERGRGEETARILAIVRGVQSEFKATGAGTAAIAAVGRVIREIEKEED